ncbi:hypothetical protein FGO68_gene4459 [Halteria grandinella]|uniref:Uncharacterized protein n=1 Tax=Halteria grandinella TaxID=5974 RepID=A0A8J8P529_HALGN|nr:hypothetical protein FGO68_gene4459 [Halteria grandinella]
MRKDSIGSQKVQQTSAKSQSVQDKYYNIWRGLDMAAALVAAAGLCIAIYAVIIYTELISQNEVDLANQLIQMQNHIPYDFEDVKKANQLI